MLYEGQNMDKFIHNAYQCGFFLELDMEFETMVKYLLTKWPKNDRSFLIMNIDNA